MLVSEVVVSLRHQNGSGMIEVGRSRFFGSLQRGRQEMVEPKIPSVDSLWLADMGHGELFGEQLRREQEVVHRMQIVWQVEQ